MKTLPDNFVLSPEEASNISHLEHQTHWREAETFLKRSQSDQKEPVVVPGHPQDSRPALGQFRGIGGGAMNHDGPYGEELKGEINLSGVPVFVALGDNTVAATVAAGVCIAPGPVPTYLGIGTATYLAGITQGGNSPFGAAGTPQAILNIATGT